MGEVQVSIIMWPLIYASCHLVCGYQHSEEHISSIFAPTMGTNVPDKHILLLNVLPRNITLYYLYQQWCMFQVSSQTILRHKNNNLKHKHACKLNIISQMKHQLDATLCRFYFCRMFEHNCEIHTNNIRNRSKLHLPHCRITTVQPGA